VPGEKARIGFLLKARKIISQIVHNHITTGGFG
jgi:hypothetical protein